MASVPPAKPLGWRVKVLWASGNSYSGVVARHSGETVQIHYDDGERERLKVSDPDITWLRQESKSNLQKAKTIRREYRNMEKSSDVAKSAQAQLCAMLAQAGATAVDGIGPAAGGGVLSELDLSPVHASSPLNSKGVFQESEIGESTVASESAATAALDSDSEEDDSDDDSEEEEDDLESSDEEEEEASDSDSEAEDSDEEEDSDGTSDSGSDEEDSEGEEGGADGDIVGSMILSMHRPEAGGRRLDIKWVWCAGGVPEATGAATGSNPVKKATIMTGEGAQSLKRLASDAFSKRLEGVPSDSVCLAYRDEDGDVIGVDSNEDVQLMHACFTRCNASGTPQVRRRVMVAPVALQEPPPLGASESKVSVAEDTVHSSGTGDAACAIKHWKQGRLLGTGSFGKVFEGLDVDSGRQVAIKTVKLPDHLMLQVMTRAGITAHDADTGAAAAPMPTKAAADDSLSGSTGGTTGSSLDELVGEIRLMQSLAHPNIVAYLGSTVIMTERKLLIFMEFASGGSLMSVLERYRSDSNPGLPADIVSRYTRHVLRGLAYLHSLKIVHRDLKPANVLLDAGVAKLADFGCSKVAAETSVETSSAIGTALYCAPELLSESPSYGTASDIWSLGITVAQLFNGELPWSGNVAHAVYKVCFSSDTPELPASAPSSAVDFVTACLAREASSRPSAEELLTFAFLS